MESSRGRSTRGRELRVEGAAEGMVQKEDFFWGLADKERKQTGDGKQHERMDLLLDHG